ncbi:FeoB-associated Cys-rich membrane protein [Daejeonella sp. H1SJ63]|jgi:hypothetical protein|uniref:FeoB-associated Cys-rich membrane protein n=1 Tax=Daejeonella sp. H1SJ63 TaxID=3034145 RepID=UPI0023EBDB5A|nr:FeoB-associated Cys-rich membrane protein [Daejeonella sp. H1SJ63]
MDIQLILVLIVFLLAVLYLGRMFYRSLNSKKGCASNCGKCTADFSDIKPSDTK